MNNYLKNKTLVNRLCSSGGMTLALGAAFVAFSLPNFAQGQEAQRVLEEIIVTAAYREQGLQDVPVSISAVSGETLVETGLQKAEDIQFLVPNLTINETGISTNVFIRGIGSGINQAFEQSVATYIDGVYYGRGQQFRSPFLDLERVEVLRGPQSILFGKNAVAGALNITTAKPTDEFQGNVRASYEFENGESIVEGFLSGSLSDNMRGRLAARSRNHDGYIDNLTLSRDEPIREDWTVRGILEVDLSDVLTATVKVEVGEYDVTGRHIEIIGEKPGASGLQYNQILTLVFGQDPSVNNVTKDGARSSNGDFSFNESQVFALTLDWDIGDYQLKSITAFSNFEYDEFCDCDFTGATVFGAALQESYEQLSQEIRLSSPLNDNYDYIVGFYYQTSDHSYADQIIVPVNSVLVPAINGASPGAGDLIAGTQAARLADVDNDVISVFAQLNWHVSDNVTVQIGGRFTNDKRDGNRTLSIQGEGGGALPVPQTAAAVVYANAFGLTSTNLVALADLGDPTSQFFIAQLGSLPVSGSRDTSKFSPELKWIWNANDDSMLFATWTQGFKSGSFDFRANNRNFYPDMETSFEFDDEEVSSVEFGGKWSLAEGAVELNATVFFTKFDDLQISIFDGILGFNVGNAASAEVNGIEVDGRWAATDHLMITGGFALTDFEFTDFLNGQCYFGQTPDVDIDGDGSFELCDYTGNSNQLVSERQAHLSFHYDREIGADYLLRGLLDAFYTSEAEASATFDPALVQPGYTKFNARLGIGPIDGQWEVALLVRNLTDEKVLQFGGDTPLAGSSFGAKSNYAFYSEGRTTTLQASFNF